MSRSAGPSNSQPASQDPPPHTQNGEEEDELESQPRRKKARRVSEEGEARDGSAATRVKEEERTNGKGKRKARMDEMDEDEDKDAAGAEQDGQNDGHERGEDEVGDGNGLNLELSAEQQRKLASRHEDGFLPGGIVRIAMRRFLTYDFTEFYPGPHLNMIVGPNGAGKSTIVNAICIGLGWSPKILGRADELPKFIKDDYKEGWTEIELKSLPGESNVIIKRALYVNKKPNSKFWINGVEATAKDVRERVQELNIQVGNLCAFLPQDKVGEFAKMSSQELLKETQKAAGHPKMTEWHQTLIRLGKEQRELEGVLQVKQEDYDRKKAAMGRMEVEVRNAEERERIASDIRFYKMLQPFSSYLTEKTKYDELKAAKAEAVEAQQAAEARCKPYSDLDEAMAKKQKRAERDVQDAAEELRPITTRLSQLKGTIEGLESSSSAVLEKINDHRNAEARQKEQLKVAERRLASAQEAVQTKREVPDARALDEQKRTAQQANRQLDARMDSEVGDMKRQLDYRARQAQRDIDVQTQAITNLNNAANQRLANLKNWPNSRDIFEVTMFVRADNAKRARGEPTYFNMHVYEPPCISADITDQRYANVVEAAVNSGQMRTIICQCPEDVVLMGKFSDAVVAPFDRRMSKLNFTSSSPNYQPHESMPRETLQQAGLDGWAIDFVKAPAAVMNYLAGECGLNRTAVSLRPVGQGGLDLEIINQANIRSFIAKDTKFSTSISQYGRRTASTNTNQIQSARSFKTSVDQESIDRAQQAIERARASLPTDADMQAIYEVERAIKEEKKTHNFAFNEAVDQMNQIAAIATANSKIDIALTTAQRQLREIQSKPSADDQLKRHQRELQKHTHERVKSTLKYQEKALEASRVTQSLVNRNLLAYQADVNKDALTGLAKADHEALDQANQRLLDAASEFKKQKQRTKARFDEANTKLDALDDDARRDFDMKKDLLEQESAIPGIDELDARILEKQQDLEALAGGDPSAIQKYNKLVDECKVLGDDLGEKKHRDQDIQTKMQSIKNKWVPELKMLVTNFNMKFSKAMDALEDRGEVRIREAVDFDDWAIEILVSFRQADKLTILTATHQSGGERSLTTIMYLMSLIELSSAPFSVVDEINQGMDQRSEREVHNQLVASTSRPEAGQFFLLTPKLLSGLHYHEKMRVLVICNGEWVPSREPGSTKERTFLRHNLRRLKRKRAAALTNGVH